MDLYGELAWRGLVYDEPKGSRRAGSRTGHGYIGFDPTASSLHVGSCW
jgi:tyrosyl-tRNA synthetase